MTRKRHITLVLFDIDGTLLHSHGAGRESFARALRHVFGSDGGIENINFAGATDLDVFNKLMSDQGVEPTPEQEEAFFQQLPLELVETTAASPVTLYPGVRELLATLAERDDVLVGLVTGNTEECAQVKLASGDIHGHFMLGAYGREHADRIEIARLAVQRAKDQLEPGQNLRAIALIGDTPSDVRAARAIGAVSIAVATGTYDQEALRAAEADYVLENLSDTASVLRVLQLGGS